MNLLQVPAYVIALGGVVSALVSATKGGIEQLLPASNKWHDLCFTLYPILLALALMVGYTLTHGGDVFWSVVWGLLSGAWGLGTYTLHTRTGSPASAIMGTAGLTIRTTPPWVPSPASPPEGPPAPEPPPGHAPDGRP